MVFKNEQMDKAFMSGVRGKPYEMKDTGCGSWPRKAYAYGCRISGNIAALEKGADNFKPAAPEPLAAPAMADKPKIRKKSATEIIDDAAGTE